MPDFTKGKWELYTHVVRVSCRVLATIRVPDSDIANIAYVPVIHGFPEQEGQANARLIAAAPEMYELLMQFAFGSCDDCMRVLDESRKLLDRIDGKEAHHD